MLGVVFLETNLIILIIVVSAGRRGSVKGYPARLRIYCFPTFCFFLGGAFLQLKAVFLRLELSCDTIATKSGIPAVDLELEIKRELVLQSLPSQRGNYTDLI